MEKTVQDAIERVVRKQLSDAQIDSVTVRQDVDHDGDEILRVFVIFDARKGQLDPDKTVSMVRHVREELHKLEESRFPIISYVSKSDAKRMKSAAA